MAYRKKLKAADRSELRKIWSDYLPEEHRRYLEELKLGSKRIDLLKGRISHPSEALLKRISATLQDNPEKINFSFSDSMYAPLKGLGIINFDDWDISSKLVNGRIKENSFELASGLWPELESYFVHKT